MKPDKHLVCVFGTILAVIGLITLTRIGTLRAVDAQRRETAARVSATLHTEALALSEEIKHPLLALDETLGMLVSAREADPDKFDLEFRRSRSVVLDGLSRDMLLTDRNGIVRQYSVVPAIDADVSHLDFFAALSAPDAPADEMFIRGATIGAIMRPWHMSVAQALHNPDGSFAGVIDADYRIAALADVFKQADLGPGGFATLVGLNDGKMGGTAGPAVVDPDVSIADTRMFAAIRRGASGKWIGPTATDPAQRIHAYRHIHDRPLVLVVAVDEAEAMRPAALFLHQALFAAGGVTALLIGLAILLLRGIRAAHWRQLAMAESRAILAAANAQLEIARAGETAKAERLEAALSGLTDGVSMFDGHLCLVGWNARFPEIAGVPAEMLRPGLPLEEVLRAQIASGQFGRVSDPEDEIGQRIARLRAEPFGVIQRRTFSGRTLELRRTTLPDGGFVTLYVDVTKRIEEALRTARDEAAEDGRAARVSFPASALPVRGGSVGQAAAPDKLHPDRAVRAPEPNDPRRPVPRTRVLLADDVLANQLVAATLLRREGHMVDVVSSGRAAVEAVQRVPYDLILMDIFTPDMGGQEASRMIRSLPEPAGRTPIVALTADVAAEDEAVFEASGMDGILGKPVSLPDLLNVLRSRVWSARPHGSDSAGRPRAVAQPPLHDPWAVLSHARIRELRANLPPETFVTLLEECVSDLDIRLPALRLAVEAGNTGAIIAHAHAMVGMAANHGMAALETRLRTILAAARDGDSRTLSGSMVAEAEADLAEAARTLRDMSQTEDVD